MLKNYSKASISKLKIIWKLSLVLLYIIKLKTINYERERERERERENLWCTYQILFVTSYKTRFQPKKVRVSIFQTKF